MSSQFGDDITVTIGDDFVAVVEIDRPPANFVSIPFLDRLADAHEALDEEPTCRAIVLCSAGKHFCAGAAIDPDDDEPMPNESAEALYASAVRMFACKTPVVAAVQGAAVGAGIGLACAADFRYAAPEARFSANFSRLGFHQGFGLTVTLPQIVGHSRSLDMLYTGRRVGGEEAAAWGLADKLVPLGDLRDEARAFAAEIAKSAPLAVRSIRETMRGHLAETVRAITLHEGEQQIELRKTNDFAEGIRAAAERRDPVFTGT